MRPRERINKAIRHEATDQVPLDLGSTIMTGITGIAYERLKKALGVDERPCRIVEPTQVLVELDEDIRRRLGVDTVGIYPGFDCYGWQEFPLTDGSTVQMPGNVQFKAREDGGWNLAMEGTTVATMPPDGLYFDALEYAKWRDYDPAALTEPVLTNLKQQVDYWYNESDYALVINTPYTFFNGTSPEFLMALVLEKEEVTRRLGIWSDHIIECLGKMLPIVNGYGSMFVFSGDIGTQKGPLIGQELYREMILPCFKRVTDFIHRHSDLKVFYHTCGSVYELIDCFIEMGVDILNPLQVSADHMEPERLVAEFGGRVVFWGGGCDTQRVLPEGSPDEVRKEVKNRLQTYTRVNGYVCTPVHNIQPDVPADNVLAMVEQVRMFGKNEVSASEG